MCLFEMDIFEVECLPNQSLMSCTYITIKANYQVLTQKDSGLITLKERRKEGNWVGRVSDYSTVLKMFMPG